MCFVSQLTVLRILHLLLPFQMVFLVPFSSLPELYMTRLFARALRCGGFRGALKPKSPETPSQVAWLRDTMVVIFAMATYILKAVLAFTDL